MVVIQKNTIEVGSVLKNGAQILAVSQLHEADHNHGSVPFRFVLARTTKCFVVWAWKEWEQVACHAEYHIDEEQARNSYIRRCKKFDLSPVNVDTE